MPVRIARGLLALLLVGCAVHTPYDRTYVSEGIAERTEFELGDVPGPGEPLLPQGVVLSDGLSGTEAITLALWNNAAFLEALAELGFARADLADAKFLSNPVFSLLLPVGPKGLETKLYFPVAELLRRGSRVAAAELDAERVAEALVYHGLGLIRDVQTAYAGYVAAGERAELAAEKARALTEIAEITAAWMQTGDISERDASLAAVRAQQAADAAAGAAHEHAAAWYGLRELIGLDQAVDPIVPVTTTVAAAVPLDPEALLETAWAARPDLRAGELGIEAAGRRVGLERAQILDLIGIIDAKDKGEPQLTVGPGIELPLPLLNQNQAGVARARAELEQAARAYDAVRQRIAREVAAALAGYETACRQYELSAERIVPALTVAAGQARGEWESGEESWLFVLEARCVLLDARLREAELRARIGRAVAELNFSAGQQIVPAVEDASREGGEL